MAVKKEGQYILGIDPGKSIIPFGFCQCGCGSKTTLGDANRPARNVAKGIPVRFIRGHFKRRNGKMNMKGYTKIKYPIHPRSDKDGYCLEHILVAERILGRHLPVNAVIHHVDGNPKNNMSSNLVICENQAYHLLLHIQKRAFKSCGNPKWRKCVYCKQYDDMVNLQRVSGKYYNPQHRECANTQRRVRSARKMASV